MVEKLRDLLRDKTGRIEQLQMKSAHLQDENSRLKSNRLGLEI
jgi:hypothetical protein